jgi:hypothetical protein
VTDSRVLPNFDREFCRRVVLTAAAVCLMLLVVAIVILLKVDPSKSYCPNWEIPAKKGTNSIWMAVLIPALPATIWICIVALRWDWAADKIVASASIPRKQRKLPSWVPQPTLNAVTFPYNRLLVCVAIGWTFACAQPLLTMGEHCLAAGPSLALLEFVLVFVIAAGLVPVFIGAGKSDNR